MYPGVGGALLLPLCWQCVCVVCAREKEQRLKVLCLLFYELGLYIELLLRPCTAHLSCQRWLSLEVRMPFNPVLVVCHRFKRTQTDPVCLPEI